MIRDGVRAGAAVPRPDVEHASRRRSERGLLSMAFAPDYATSGRFYVYLTAQAPAGRDPGPRVPALGGDPDVADPASGRLLLAIPHTEAANHNGGQLQFGPDGKLWLGDRRRRRRQRPVRPRAGPGVAAGQADPARPGARRRRRSLARRAAQPVAVLVRPRDGQLVIADVGQGAVEEIDVGAGRQLRLAVLRGHARGPRTDPRCDDAATAPPVLAKRTPATASARSPAATSCATRPADAARPLPLRRLLRARAALGRPREPGDRRRRRARRSPSLSSFGEDACGRILVVSLGGPVYRLVDGAPSPCGSPRRRRRRARPADTRACARRRRA